MNSEEQVIILLHITEGIGLNLKEDNCNVVISASLGGEKLETEIFLCGDTTYFHSNLIWETDKNSIKRMKTENLPIKLECFETNILYGQNVRKLIGYILIPIRGVPILQPKKTPLIKPHWHKLNGLTPEWKTFKPEISLFLSITSKASPDKLLSTIKQSDIIGDRIEKFEMDVNKTSEMLFTQKGIFIQLLQNEGLLQVGDKASDCDIFIVKLMFKNAINLEQIINPAEDMNRLFRFHYNLLGTPTHCPLTPRGNGVFIIQEQIAIHFRTSLKSLREYFNNVLYIPINLYYNETIVGTAQFKFSNLLEIDDLKTFTNQFSATNFTLTNENKFPIETCYDLPPSLQQPFVEYIFSLKYLSTAKISNCEIILDKPQLAEYIDYQAGGDKNEEDQNFELPPTKLVERNNLVLRDTNSDIIINNNEINDFQQNSSHKSKSTTLLAEYNNEHNQLNDKIDMNSFLLQKHYSKTTKDALRTFSFNLILQTVKFNRRPEIGIFQLSLHHQKSDTLYTIANVQLTEITSNVIEFNNLELQLFFSSTTESILELVASESCTLKIIGPHGLVAIAEIDNEILFVSTKEKRSGVILMENQTGENIAMTHISVYLDDLGINFNSQMKRQIDTDGKINLANIDETLTYKVVEELEDWKEQQQEMFLVELKRKEVNIIGKLSSEWQTKKSDQETQLTKKLEECTKLSQTLEEAHKSLREHGMDRIERERLLECTRKEMEAIHAIKILELEENYRRIEDDLAQKLKLESLRYQEMKIAKENLEKDNMRIEKELKDLSESFDEMKKSYLPKDQLSGIFQDVRILNERLDEVQKSKIFYKGQWAKIIREVHKIKSNNSEVIDRTFEPFHLQDELQSAFEHTCDA